MNVFEFVIVLMLVILGYKLWETKINQKTTVPEETEEEDLNGKLQVLEERIQVLERIVTDSQYDLKREFQDLEQNARDDA